MIKIENVDAYGWEAAIRGMRNPMNSWGKSDSGLCNDKLTKCENYVNCKLMGGFCVGKDDLKLMQSLVKAGTDHSKFMRMINVTLDIVAPSYWIAEHDTYKIGAVRNSCSFMHKGVSQPFTIDDFSVQNKQIYYLLSPIETEKHSLIYPYETDEYKIYETENGRKYKVYRNGRIVRCAFSYTDNYGLGRTRNFEESECKPSINKNGYYEINLGGRKGEKVLLHRLVAIVWKPNSLNYDTVNHINGNKGDNSAENLEWCTRAENIKKGFDTGLYDKNNLHLSYNSWKHGHKIVNPAIRSEIINRHDNGMTRSKLRECYGLTQKQIDNILYQKKCDNAELFYQAYIWEQVIDVLNSLRELYLETKDENIFKEIRQLLPSGYNVRYTWQANYAVLRNMYHSRKAHKLDEWRDFCKWIETLPYAKELICYE